MIDLLIKLVTIVDFYNQFAEDNTVPLFHYRKKRCFITISKIYDPHCNLQPVRNVYHNALDDATVQAIHFMNIVKKFDLKIN